MTSGKVRPAIHTASGSGWFVSLDAFRGFAIAGMLLVNNPGTGSADVCLTRQESPDNGVRWETAERFE